MAIKIIHELERAKIVIICPQNILNCELGLQIKKALIHL